MARSTKTRALTDAEVKLMADSFYGKYEYRDRALFLLGVRTGYRVSELLRLTIGDFIQYGEVVSRISITNTKNGSTRSVPLHPEAQETVAVWIAQLRTWGITKATNPVFVSQKDTTKAISRVQAYRIIKVAAKCNRLSGVVATHSMRKTLGRRAYEVSGENIYKVADVLGHRDVNSTRHYLDIPQKEIDAIILAC